MKNKKIYAIAPSGLINRKKFENALDYLKKNENQVYLSEQIYSSFRNMAGTDEQRLSSLIEALEADVDYVWAIRGGFGALRLLHKIPQRLKIKKKTLLIGYSDITAYQLYLYKLYKLKSVSSHMLQVDLPFPDSDETRHFISLLENKKTNLYLGSDVNVRNNCDSEAVILGGCLSIISKMLGTNYLPSFKDKILFLEDINEEHYKIDGYFAHLMNAGVFEELKGVIFGKFRFCSNKVDTFIDIEDLIDEYFSDYKYPVISNLAFGHIQNMIAMPIGYKCRITKESLEFIND